MDNHIRNTTLAHTLPDNLWQTLEKTNKSRVERLIENLERCVSNGWFGAAAELSDSLESSPYLDTEPSWRIRVELERMKRYYYLGFNKKARSANKKVINYLNKFEHKCKEQDIVLWKSTVLGHQAMTSTNCNIVKKLNNTCKELRNHVHKEDEMAERTSFIEAAEGHYWFLKKNKEKFQNAFEKAINISEAKNRLRSYSYIKILYAERLILIKDWEKAIQIINDFLSTSYEKQFKTHLLIRALTLLFSLPSVYLKAEEMKYNVLRYQFLIHAMGLSQSQALYPQLAKAKEIIYSHSEFIDFYNLDLRNEIRKNINNLSPVGFEKFIQFYYQSLKGYEIIPLPKGESAFDAIVSYTAPDNTKFHSALQVKSGKTTILKRDIPDSETLGVAKKYLIEKYSINSLSAVHWFHIADITTGAYNALKSRSQSIFGESCKIDKTGIDDLIIMALGKPPLVLQMLFGNESK